MEGKADVEQARPRARVPCIVASVCILLGVTLLASRPLIFVASPPDLLHAVPSTELVVTPELATASPVHEELFGALFATQDKDGAVYGSPPVKPVVAAIDFQGQTAPLKAFPPLKAVPASLIQGGALAFRIAERPVTAAMPPPPTPPSASPPSPSPSPSAKPKPWLLEMARPPRPANGSHPIPDGTRGRWAFAVQDVRPGTVLLANQPFGKEKSYFDGAAVLLLKVCGCHPSIFGIILSAPSGQKMDASFCPTSRRNYPAFLNSSVRLGGPVGPHWSLLHTLPDIGAEQLADGLYMGGSLAQAQGLVSAGRANSNDVLFYAGYAAWPIERLESEVRSGQWSVAKASPTLLMEAAKKGDAHTLLSLAVAK